MYIRYTNPGRDILVYTITFISSMSSFQTVTIFPHYKDNKVYRIFFISCLRGTLFTISLHYFILHCYIVDTFIIDCWVDIFNNHNGSWLFRPTHIYHYNQIRSHYNQIKGHDIWRWIIYLVSIPLSSWLL